MEIGKDIGRKIVGGVSIRVDEFGKLEKLAIDGKVRICGFDVGVDELRKLKNSAIEYEYIEVSFYDQLVLKEEPEESQSSGGGFLFYYKHVGTGVKHFPLGERIQGIIKTGERYVRWGDIEMVSYHQSAHSPVGVFSLKSSEGRGLEVKVE